MRETDASAVRFEQGAFDALDRRTLHDLLRLREEVFVVEQRITAEAEIDGRDPTCTHVVGRAPDGSIVATARLEPVADGSIKVGRVAVHAAWRGRGVGRRLMEHVHGLLDGRTAVLSAQAHLEAWYARLGWRREGASYPEAGIEHVLMRRPG